MQKGPEFFEWLRREVDFDPEFRAQVIEALGDVRYTTNVLWRLANLTRRVASLEAWRYSKDKGLSVTLPHSELEMQATMEAMGVPWQEAELEQWEEPNEVDLQPVGSTDDSKRARQEDVQHPGRGERGRRDRGRRVRSGKEKVRAEKRAENKRKPGRAGQASPGSSARNA